MKNSIKFIFAFIALISIISCGVITRTRYGNGNKLSIEFQLLNRDHISGSKKSFPETISVFRDDKQKNPNVTRVLKVIAIDNELRYSDEQIPYPNSTVFYQLKEKKGLQKEKKIRFTVDTRHETKLILSDISTKVDFIYPVKIDFKHKGYDGVGMIIIKTMLTILLFIGFIALILLAFSATIVSAGATSEFIELACKITTTAFDAMWKSKRHTQRRPRRQRHNRRPPPRQRLR